MNSVPAADNFAKKQINFVGILSLCFFIETACDFDGIHIGALYGLQIIICEWKFAHFADLPYVQVDFPSIKIRELYSRLIEWSTEIQCYTQMIKITVDSCEVSPDSIFNVIKEEEKKMCKNLKKNRAEQK